MADSPFPQDDQFREFQIAEVIGNAAEGWWVSSGDGIFHPIGRTDESVQPKSGDTVRLYGDPARRPRGVFLNGQMLFYRTPLEQEIYEEQEREALRAEMAAREAEEAKAIADAGAPTEREMREAEVPFFDSEEELIAYIRGLVDRPHDYGTCVYAMSMAAVAAFKYVSKKLGVTGFQASCADLDILRRTRGWEWGKLLDFDELLYPQYCDEEHFPSVATLLEKHADELAKRARQKIEETGGKAHPNVLKHWQRLAANGAA